MKTRIFHFWQIVSQITKGLGKPVRNLQKFPDFRIRLIRKTGKTGFFTFGIYIMYGKGNKIEPSSLFFGIEFYIILDKRQPLTSGSRSERGGREAAASASIQNYYALFIQSKVPLFTPPLGNIVGPVPCSTMHAVVPVQNVRKR